MLSNAYFLAKFRYDTAENEPAKKLQNLANFPNFANPNPFHRWTESGGHLPPTAPAAPSRTVGLPEPAEAHGDPSLFPKTVKALRNRPLQASGAAVPEAPSQTVGLPEPADGRKLSC